MYIAKQRSTLNRILTFLIGSKLSLMCSGGVSVIILGVDVDAAVQPVITLFDGSNATRSGVSVALPLQLALYLQPKYYSSLLVSYIHSTGLHNPVCLFPLMSSALPT